LPPLKRYNTHSSPDVLPSNTVPHPLLKKFRQVVLSPPTHVTRKEHHAGR
jgi:hypothetical protein